MAMLGGVGKKMGIGLLEALKEHKIIKYNNLKQIL
jgi:hypothetical protein